MSSEPVPKLLRPYFPATCEPYVLQLERRLEILERKYEKALSLLAMAQARPIRGNDDQREAQ